MKDVRKECGVILLMRNNKSFARFLEQALPSLSNWAWKSWSQQSAYRGVHVRAVPMFTEANERENETVRACRIFKCNTRPVRVECHTTFTVSMVHVCMCAIACARAFTLPFVHSTTLPLVARFSRFRLVYKSTAHMAWNVRAKGFKFDYKTFKNTNWDRAFHSLTARNLVRGWIFRLAS